MNHRRPPWKKVPSLSAFYGAFLPIFSVDQTLRCGCSVYTRNDDHPFETPAPAGQALLPHISKAHNTVFLRSVPSDSLATSDSIPAGNCSVGYKPVSGKAHPEYSLLRYLPPDPRFSILSPSCSTNDRKDSAEVHGDTAC